MDFFVSNYMFFWKNINVWNILGGWMGHKVSLTQVTVHFLPTVTTDFFLTLVPDISEVVILTQTMVFSLTLPK